MAPETAFHERLSQLFPQELGLAVKPVGAPAEQTCGAVPPTAPEYAEEPPAFEASTVYEWEEAAVRPVWEKEAAAPVYMTVAPSRRV